MLRSLNNNPLVKAAHPSPENLPDVPAWFQFSIIDTDRHNKDDEPVALLFSIGTENNSSRRAFQFNTDLVFIKVSKCCFEKRELNPMEISSPV